MKNVLITGVTIVVLYLLFICYLLVYSNKIEKLNDCTKNSSISINYSE